MATDFDCNTFEHDYIIRVLELFLEDLKTDVPPSTTIDKYAVQLTAFMNGMIYGAVKR